MSYLNKDRILIQIIKELSSEMSFSISFFANDWIICLEKNDIISYIYGYEWEVNSTVSQLISKDKGATYEILKVNDISAIEHKTFYKYSMQNKFVCQSDGWEALIDYAQKHSENGNYQIICKPNRGTGGNRVSLITNQFELEKTVHSMFSKYRDFCLSPFYHIENEYRVIVLNNEALIIYAKDRPFITGNGKDDLGTLIIEKYGKNGVNFLKSLQQDLDIIIPNNERRTISWKHNLGRGAKPIMSIKETIKNDVLQIAINTARILKIRLASIDIVEANGKLYVLEVNSGIMMENFARQKTDDKFNYYEIAKNIYRKALESVFS